MKDQAPNCIQWCQAARDCLGAELYDRLVGRGRGDPGPGESP